jgi:oxygen-dependent protoporphyrinogen oxidase
MADQDWQRLFEELQLNPIVASPLNRSRYIWFKEKRVRVPMSLPNFFSTPLLSRAAKLKILTEIFRTTSLPEEDLNLSDFIERVFHRDVVENMLDPFVGGIYAGDVRQLSASSCFPKLWDAVKDSGSILRGMMKRKSRGRPKMISFARGLNECITALQNHLKTEIHLDAKVERIGRAQSGWRLDSNVRSEIFQHIILTTPAHETSRLLNEILTNDKIKILKSIVYQRVGVWVTAFDRPRDFESGFGTLVPRNAKQAMLGSLWGSEMFSGRCGHDELLTTQFFSGSSVPKDPNLHLDFLKKVLGVSTNPQWQEFRVYENAIPQFALYHRSKVDHLRKSLPEGIHLAGNYLDGVGLSHVMMTAQSVVKNILSRGARLAV